MVLHVANLQSDESHMNSEPSMSPHFTAAFVSEELQHLSYCCQHLDLATELSLMKDIFPFFLAYIYVASFSFSTALYASLNFLVFSHTAIHHRSLSS